MKRPNKKDYLLIENVDASCKRQYYFDLEKYCDELEEANYYNSKALDKACYMLEEINYEPFEYGNIYTMEKWKKYFYNKVWREKRYKKRMVIEDEKTE